MKKTHDSAPKVVAIGGGHGLSTLLRGLKDKTENLTAIVTVADEGGGSGVLRQEIGMLPPGDIRSCIEALANTESVMKQLLSYRFKDGSLKGQAFGNLLLAALDGISGSFDEAVSRMSEVLAITGRVLPVTNENIQLEAVFENGSRILGESKICNFKKTQDCRITHVNLLPEHPVALPAATDAIREADLIVLGPGSLYTSVIPNLLVDGIADAICNSGALKMYVGNVMTQEGETEGYTMSDHVAALLKHGGAGLLDICLCNDAPMSDEILERYRSEGAEPIKIDREKLNAMGVEVAVRRIASSNSGFARHSARLLAEAVMALYEERAETRIF